MFMRVLNFSAFAALLFAGLTFGSAPASAQCGGCYVPVYQPCGCGSVGYYGGYYQSTYGYAANYGVGYGGGCCATGYGYGSGYGGYAYGGGYGYGGGYVGAAAPYYYRPRVAYPRYWGARRVFARY
ncbi:MAG TPA: hypothetical protein VFB88_16030 [Xanthobacteraceae bacterium]|jgi:hypothetical protein|nr:hypothetical protein [Xanthobacteraceae bacterium]